MVLKIVIQEYMLFKSVRFNSQTVAPCSVATKINYFTLFFISETKYNLIDESTSSNQKGIHLKTKHL